MYTYHLNFILSEWYIIIIIIIIVIIIIIIIIIIKLALSVKYIIARAL